MDKAVEDRVGESGVSHHIVPVVEWKLAGDEGGSSAVAVFEDLEEIGALSVLQGGEPEVIEDEELGLGQAIEELGIGAVGASESNLPQEAREAEVARKESVSARAVSEDAGQIALSIPRSAGDQDVLVVSNPLATGQTEYETAVEATWTPEVDVLGGGRESELRHLEEKA